VAPTRRQTQSLALMCIHDADEQQQKTKTKQKRINNTWQTNPPNPFVEKRKMPKMTGHDRTANFRSCDSTFRYFRTDPILNPKHHVALFPFEPNNIVCLFHSLIFFLKMDEEEILSPDKWVHLQRTVNKEIVEIRGDLQKRDEFVTSTVFTFPPLLFMRFLTFTLCNLQTNHKQHAHIEWSRKDQPREKI
jgi:hypothetical protein